MKVALLVLLCALAAASTIPAASAGRRHLLQGAPQPPKPAPATTPAKATPAATPKPAPVAPKAPANATAPVKGRTAPVVGVKGNVTGNATVNGTAGQGARWIDLGDEAGWQSDGPKMPIAPRQPTFGRRLLSALAGRRHLLQGAPQLPKPAPAAAAKPAPVAPKAPGNATAPVKGRTAPVVGVKGNATVNGTVNGTAVGQGARWIDLGDAADAPWQTASTKMPIAPKQPTFGRRLLSALAAVAGPRCWASTAGDQQDRINKNAHSPQATHLRPQTALCTCCSCRASLLGQHCRGPTGTLNEIVRKPRPPAMAKERRTKMKTGAFRR